MLEILKKIPILIDSMNKTTLKRLIIYFILSYPIFVMYFFKDEVKLLISSYQSNVELLNLADAQQRCFTLRNKYGAEAVLLYVYQPSGPNKSYKERMIFSSGEKYIPLESMKMINLYSRSRILEELKQNSYSLITQTSGHQESSILKSYNLNKEYIIPLVEPTSKELIGEVIWVFETDIDINVADLIVESQIFSYNIKQ